MNCMTSMGGKSGPRTFLVVAVITATVLGAAYFGLAADQPADERSPISPAVENPSSAPPSVETEPGPESSGVQERAVIRDHRLEPKQFTPSQQLPPPGAAALQPAAPNAVPNPPAFGLLPGEFAIIAYLKNTPFTARDGGHHSIDAVYTASTVIGPNQRFKLSAVQPDFTTILASGGYYVSAVPNLGGLPNVTQPVQTELRTPDRDIALFRLNGPSAQGIFTIQTYGGYFLTALRGGGKTTDPFHTDATKAGTWEYYWILKCGDLGSGYTYAIKPTGTGVPGTPVNFLTATGGGGQTAGAITAFSGLNDNSKFKLIKQSDGSYALQTPNRVNYVTAVGGGGLAGGVNLQTDRTQAQAWEQFKIVEQGNCSYTIQTTSGFYLAVGAGGTKISTRISDPNAAPSIGYNAKFELIMIGL